MARKFLETVRDYGFSERDFKISYGTTLRIFRKYDLDAGKLILKTKESLIALCFGFDYAIHRFSDAAQLTRDELRPYGTLVFALDEISIFNVKNYKDSFEPLLEAIIKNHYTKKKGHQE